jgi:GNAT superfamily N-acetyltransferase
MVSYHTTTDESIARDFFRRVQDALYWEEAVTDLEATNGFALVRRRIRFRLDLFSPRGTFIAAVYAEELGNVVGLYSLRELDGKAHVDLGYVVSKYRRHGLGGQLLERACGHLLAQGRQPAYLLVRTREMARLVERLRGTLAPDSLCASVDFDDMARDLKDDLYE